MPKDFKTEISTNSIKILNTIISYLKYSTFTSYQILRWKPDRTRLGQFISTIDLEGKKIIILAALTTKSKLDIGDFPREGFTDPPPLPGKVNTKNFLIGLSYVKLNSEQKSSPMYPCQKLIVFEIFNVLY